jgi:hypothetical protein
MNIGKKGKEMIDEDEERMRGIGREKRRGEEG